MNAILLEKQGLIESLEGKIGTIKEQQSEK